MRFNILANSLLISIATHYAFKTTRFSKQEAMKNDPIHNLTVNIRSWFLTRSICWVRVDTNKSHCPAEYEWR